MTNQTDEIILEQRAKEYASDCMGQYDPELQDEYDDIVRHFKAGANSSQHGGDAGKLVLWNGIEREMEDVESLEHARQWLRENYADPEDGIHPDIELCEIYRLVARVAVVDGKQPGTSRIEVQPVQSTSIPAGIVEQLRKAYKKDLSGITEVIWNECCDTLASLLSEKRESSQDNSQILLFALKQIEQMKNPGNYAKAIVGIKTIAGDAITKFESLQIIKPRPFNWKILNSADDLTEDQWKDFVEEATGGFSGQIKGFRDYMNRGLDLPPCKTAKESGFTLLKAAGIDPSRVTIIIKYETWK